MKKIIITLSLIAGISSAVTSIYNTTERDAAIGQVGTNTTGVATNVLEIASNYTSITSEVARATAANALKVAITDGISTNQSLVTPTLNNAVINTNIAAPTWKAGQIWYSTNKLSHVCDTGVSDVRVNIAQEQMRLCYNGTGSTISNGVPVSWDNTVVNGVRSVRKAAASNLTESIYFFGVATADIADGEVGFASTFGEINDVDTSCCTTGVVYLAACGGLTNAIPDFPTRRMRVGWVTEVGTTGTMAVDMLSMGRSSVVKSYTFTSQGIGAGTYWVGGFYNWNETDANLDEGSTSVTLGTDGSAVAAHVGIVASGAGAVDTGQVGLRVTGTEDSETGIQVATQTAIITDDITTLAADTLVDTTEKFSGDVVIEFYTVSGSPTAYSLDFNYGYSKYEDFGNRDVTITGFEAIWLGAAADTANEIKLLKHTATGWTYAATAFEAGSTAIADSTVDQATDGDVANGEVGAYKRTGLNTKILSKTTEGALVKIVTGANNTYQNLNIHVGAVSEEIGK